MYLVLVNRLGSLPRNSVVRLTDQLDMTIIVEGAGGGGGEGLNRKLNFGSH